MERMALALALTGLMGCASVSSTLGGVAQQIDMGVNYSASRGFEITVGSGGQELFSVNPTALGCMATDAINEEAPQPGGIRDVLCRK